MVNVLLLVAVPAFVFETVPVIVISYEPTSLLNELDTVTNLVSVSKEMKPFEIGGLTPIEYTMSSTMHTECVSIV